ncbi:MAG: hypothetical protein V8Q86_12150 [Blautia sp.]
MSKSVLVMDTPERGCISCSIGQNDSNCRITRIYCPIAEETAFDEEAETIPDWCPLKSLPDKKEYIVPIDNVESQKDIIAVGWNACIDEITGGE